jgi:hypothetical protein
MKLNKLSLGLSIAIISLIISLIFSYKKGNSSKGNNVNPNIPIISTNATIIDEGDPAVDGCGWIIKTDEADSTFNVPDLAGQYKIANLKVHIDYHKLTTRYFWGFNPVGITEIKLDTITAR